MNKKQLIVALIMLVSVFLVFMFPPSMSPDDLRNQTLFSADAINQKSHLLYPAFYLELIETFVFGGLLIFLLRKQSPREIWVLIFWIIISTIFMSMGRRFSHLSVAEFGNELLAPTIIIGYPLYFAIRFILWVAKGFNIKEQLK